MSVQRKCPKCNTWNGNEDYCTVCNELLNPILIEDLREEKREARRQNVAPSRLDLFIDRWKHSRFLVLRILFRILYAIGFTFIAIASFFAWLAASPNG